MERIERMIIPSVICCATGISCHSLDLSPLTCWTDHEKRLLSMLRDHMKSYEMLFFPNNTNDLWKFLCLQLQKPHHWPIGLSHDMPFEMSFRSLSNATRSSILDQVRRLPDISGFPPLEVGSLSHYLRVFCALSGKIFVMYTKPVDTGTINSDLGRYEATILQLDF